MTRECQTKENKIRIITEPDLALFEKVIEYVNWNLASGVFPLLMRTDLIPKEQAKVWLDKNKAGEQAVAIALDDGVVVGAAHLDIGCKKEGRTGDLNVTVDKMYRRRGIGESLVQCLIDQAKEYELVKIEAEPRVDNLPAVSLFKKFGFKTTSQRKLRTSVGELVTFHHMVLHLRKECNDQGLTLMESTTHGNCDKSDLRSLLEWRVESFNHIRWLEDTSWRSATLIVTFTITVISVITQYLPEATLWSSFLIVALNLIGVQILFRNRRGFLQKLYTSSITERILAECDDNFRKIIEMSPKEWRVEKSEVLQKKWVWGTVFMSLVYLHILILVVAHIWALVRSLQFSLAPPSMLVLITALSAIVTILVLIIIVLLHSYWWDRQRWSQKTN